MDPVSVTIVGALAAGAAAGIKEIATSAIKDAYAALKKLLLDRHPAAAPLVTDIEAEPGSESEQVVLAKQLSKAGPDEELKALSVALLEALEKLQAEPKAQALLDFDELRAMKSFSLREITVSGTLLHARQATFEGDFSLEKVQQVQPEKK